MYLLSKSIDFYWLMLSASPVQRAPHRIQKEEFERIATHFEMDAARITTAARDTKYLGNLGVVASLAFGGLAIRGVDASPALGHLACGLAAFVALVLALRLRRAAWRLEHRQMSGWLEVMLPTTWAFRMRDEYGRGPAEVEAGQ